MAAAVHTRAGMGSWRSRRGHPRRCDRHPHLSRMVAPAWRAAGCGRARDLAMSNVSSPSVPTRNAASLAAKRAYDFVLAGAGLLVLAPVFAAISAAVKLGDRGP